MDELESGDNREGPRGDEAFPRTALTEGVTVEAEDLLPDGHPERVTIFDVSSVREAMALLPLKRSMGIVILVNGKLGQFDTPLRDGDIVTLIPALGGG